MEGYIDRSEAGSVLAEKLQQYADRKDVIVLALPRGGVPVAYEIAKKLHVPLDVFIVRKLGVPSHSELAMGAIAMNKVTVFNQDILAESRIAQSDIDPVIESEYKELQRREKKYRGTRPFPDLKNKIIILVDDGIATGATMRVAIKALRQQKPAHIIVAVPVVSKDVYQQFLELADKIISPLLPEYLFAVGQWYESFPQTTDEEVIALLNK